MNKLNSHKMHFIPFLILLDAKYFLQFLLSNLLKKIFFTAVMIGRSKMLSVIWFDRRVRCALFAFLMPNLSIPLIEFCCSDGIGGIFGGSQIEALFLPLWHLLLVILCLIAFPASRHRWKFTVQSFLLGLANGWAIMFALRYGTARLHTLCFCTYVYFFSLFHFAEFLMTALTNIDSLRPDSFLLNHSPAYWTAAMCSWMEFWARAWIFPSLCTLYISAIGVLCCVVGELFRKLAMCHASVGFTHQIAVRKQRDHRLCTDGVYSLVRHPGYLGWLIWSVGTQLILCNPICSQAYAYVSFRFFEDRIWEEERYLIEFFGQRYIAYQRYVPSGIPFIRGYHSHKIHQD